MINVPDLVKLVTDNIPDAEVNCLDKTGVRDHYIIHVTSSQFEGQDVMSRHRMVQECLTAAMQDGRLHAAEIKTAVPGS